MPAATAPIPLKEVPTPVEKSVTLPETLPFADIDLDEWAVIADQASREAQADLHRQGISYVIGRNGALFEVLPGGQEIPYQPQK